MVISGLPKWSLRRQSELRRQEAGRGWFSTFFLCPLLHRTWYYTTSGPLAKSRLGPESLVSIC